MSLEYGERRVQNERRLRQISEEDISAIVSALRTSQGAECVCRFDDITVDDMREAIKFAKNMNEAMESSRRVVWKTVLILGTTLILSLLGWGIVKEIGAGLGKMK